MKMSDSLGTYVIVDDASFEDFDKQRKIYRQQNPNCEAIAECHLLLHWIAETSRSHVCKTIEHNKTYYILNDEELEDLAWWVQVQRDNID